MWNLYISQYYFFLRGYLKLKLPLYSIHIDRAPEKEPKNQPDWLMFKQWASSQNCVLSRKANVIKVE
jgi:hypothetical protein